MSSPPKHPPPHMPPRLPQVKTKRRPTFGGPEDDEQRDENLEREIAKLRAHFEEKITNKTTGHRRVAVLLLYWDPTDKTVLDVSDEVDQLRKTFEEIYGFKVYEGKLTMAPRKAKECINMHMAKFMYEENYEDTLLIIYYAGHGGLAMGTAEGLKLTGNQSLRNDTGNDTGKEIVWDKAETLLEDAKADMLLIFDCCHAARAGRPKRRALFSDRIYEVLAACQADELTPGPGALSFTSALIWALQQLAEPPRAFTTSQLYDMILNSPGHQFQDGMEEDYIPHHPYWSEKAGYHSLQRLKITPKSVQVQCQAEVPSRPAKFKMHIQLLSSEIPNIGDISKLCQKLKDVLHPDDPGSTFHQVLWRDFAPAEVEKKHFAHIAEVSALKWKQKMMQRRIDQISEGSSEGPELPISPLSKDDLMSAEAVLASPPQIRRETSGTALRTEKTGHDGHPIASQFRWIVSGIGLLLLGYVCGKSKELTG